MEWLDKGTYTYEFLHPPLARVAMAVGPYLKGLRSHSLANFIDEGNAILYSDGDYWGNLSLARLGNLPFLVLASVVILLWARRWFSRAAGLWALFLFLNLPPILGHAGLATLDVACAATVIAALYQFMRWLETPAWRRAIGLGVGLALAFLVKFSSLAFLATCCATAAIYFFLAKRDRAASYRHLRLRLGQACLTGCVTLVLLWAGYRFSMVPVSHSVGSHSRVDEWISSTSVFHKAAYKFVETPLPLDQVLTGIAEVYAHTRLEGGGYLFGQYRDTGFWYFFPVVVALKTPIGFLILAAWGVVAMLRRWTRGPWQHCLTALFPVPILLICMTSRINFGVRHILSIYPPLALAAGYAISAAFRGRSRRSLAVVSVLLAGSVLADACLAHPDYMAWFNQFAGRHPEKLLCESDLDWGQDLHRLSQRLNSLGVKQVSIGYFGTVPLEKAGLPEYHILSPDEKSIGYVAVSVRYTNLEYAEYGSYGWLRKYQPLERIGKSIDLYRIDR